MQKKIVIKIFYITIFFFILISLIYFYIKEREKNASINLVEERIVEEEIVEEQIVEEEKYTSSNILKNVKYSAKDLKPNLLII